MPKSAPRACSASALATTTLARALARAAAGACLVCGSAAAAASPPAVAAETPTWRYAVERGDTLIGISRRWLAQPRQWRALQRLNRIADARRLRPGRVLHIPLAWLRQEAAAAEVLHVTGEVMLMRPGEADMRPAVGATLRSGDLLRTGAQGVLSLRFVDGSRLLVRPGSTLRVEQLSLLPQGNTSDVRVRLEQGSADSDVVPLSSPGRRYEITTPSANLGVRGTRFRSHAEPAGGTSRVEVLEGEVAARGAQHDGQEVRVAGGLGSAIEAGQPPQPPVPLPAAPALDPSPLRLERLPLHIEWQAAPAAVAYQAQLLSLSATGAPEHVLLDGRFAGAAARWSDLPDGRYLLRLRAVDARGFEGLDAQREVVLKARPEPPLPLRPAAGAVLHGSEVTFAWSRQTEAARYRLQVARDGAFTQPLVDRDDLAATEVRVALPPGVHHWRVGSVRASGDRGPFGDAQRVELRAVPASPAVEPPEVRRDGLTLRWRDGGAGGRYQLQVAIDDAFKQMVHDGTTAQTHHTLVDPAPGTYHVRLRSIDADGFAGPFGAVHEVTVPRSPWWWLLVPLLLLAL